MSNTKKFLIGLIILIIPFLVWYLFIKKSDFTISFKAKTATGTIFQGVCDLSTPLSKNQNETYTIINKRNFDYVEQKATSKNEDVNYTWNINPINDSITEVKVAIKDQKNSIYNRLTLPFFNTDFKQEQLKKISDFKNGLNDHLKNFKVIVDGEKTSENIYVAYINLKSVLQEKAQTMIMNDAEITGYLGSNHIKIMGRPYLEVVSLDYNSEEIEFNYCFPIDKNTKYIPDNKVKFKELKSIKGIGARYYGNYRTSDRAWYAVFDYAKKNNIKLNYKIIEHFMDNPFNGGDETKWETKILIPYLTKK